MTAAPDILADMARGWGLAPSSTMGDLRERGIVAAYWQDKDPRAKEISAEPDPSHHILSFNLLDVSGEMRLDGRTAFAGGFRARTAHLVRAGQRPVAVTRGPIRVLRICISDAFLARMAETGAPSVSGTSVELLDPRCAYDSEIERVGRTMLTEMREGRALSRLRVDLLGQDLAIHLLRHHSNLRGTRALACVTPTRGGLAPWQLRRVREYLAAHLAADVSLGELAALVQLSPSHFCRAHKQATGTSPLQSLTALRMERAKALLADPRLPIIEVAAACGYESPSAFAQVFRRETGVTPSEWRRRI